MLFQSRPPECSVGVRPDVGAVFLQLESASGRGTTVEAPLRFARRGSRPRDGQEPGFPRLGGKANGGIGGAKTLIVAALHDLEEEDLLVRTFEGLSAGRQDP